jgi:hypothetical protein
VAVTSLLFISNFQIYYLLVIVPLGLNLLSLKYIVLVFIFLACPMHFGWTEVKYMLL